MCDEFYMSLAINRAWEFQFLTYPNPAVGCVIVSSSGEILAIEAHEKAGNAHAELNAVKSALCQINSDYVNSLGRLKNANEIYDFILQNHSNLLKDMVAYVTLEPCSHQGRTPSCAMLLSKLGFKRVVISTKDTSKQASGGEDILRKHGIQTKLGVCKSEVDLLLEPFWTWSNGNFTFFKIALSQNGVASGGTISNLLSRTHTHKLRSLVDMLIIGGNSVRTDLPTLDTRLISGGVNPDILVYSHSKDFDKSIPLFSVKDRNVEISSSLDPAFERKFVMYEGGGNALSNLDKRIKWLLIYRSNEFKSGKNISLDLKINILHTTKFDNDELLWCKIIE
ncbi:bifunctional diaminohydroxyphosphoribosylaminopyrimidine deaminase/5-amino-6-(5-phosphoribosylamino)uracil reductase RibD [Campylobacter hyointestinalis]|uniref:Bifunctional diaminohydroxyphosphoribosylaminopyrimidine deaminase/5-amino-6-(5-phosphoribosylamino)uracil reductase RibD n=1 Tax=Campylobacter hyointestinalis subsp. lawsonii TaxID=91353 RepID=A0AAV6EIE6_CAMHY|nr:bifunctional diaminohydroxyphosphoribosylaminopyrimidine deaminase/5-amino-6-(5-phosphoribosylamino)uracil reductase RibD [Campylobacter hyointestinalis]KAB0614360.1 bifunctional diaminohydroxyphosphoribosylaminopyrimidine deaminase/5-amino-6-(5-phosphoribosylamino)uracil reductase RibD [Campylobacter hyointestinalis subsp. lawsonii]QKF70115.1 diaminohydroxyphosphoribosylaminopyrimidine deaminase / 5-amino-6-(5-phosphoribosylamino)uracil reductase [Campylobacter hyointestinalis subsp. lawsonii